MQPENQQGYYQPGTDPNVPAAPQQPQPVASQPMPAVNPADLQAALAEPAPTVPQQPAPAPEAVAEGEVLEDEDYEDDEEFIEPVTWMAHEYIHQEKGATWFMVFGVILLLTVGLTVWLQQWTFTAVLVVIAVVIVVNSKRPPRELTYALTDEGLTIDGKVHPFENFKSFGVIHDGLEFSVVLIPTQRFQPSVSVYFPEESGEAIVDSLGSRLPMKDLKLDVVDHIVRWLRL